MKIQRSIQLSKIQRYFAIIDITLHLWRCTQLFFTSLELNLDRKVIHLSSVKPDLFAISTSKHKSVSYRRNKDYSKQFNWTYELNEDLYRCYMEAREVPKKGYMARMKKMWDKLHPELNHFTRIWDNKLHISRNKDIFYKLLTLLIAT